MGLHQAIQVVRCHYLDEFNIYWHVTYGAQIKQKILRILNPCLRILMDRVIFNFHWLNTQQTKGDV